MRILGIWIAGGMALTLGYGLGLRCPGLGEWLAFAMLGAGTLTVIRAIAAPRSGRPEAVGLLLLAMLGRGSDAARADEPQRWPHRRGAPHGVRTLKVQEASFSGPRCRLRVRSGTVALWLDAPSSACPLAQGQRIRVREDRMGWRTTAELPGDSSPATGAHSKGAVAWVVVDQVWRAGGEAEAYWGWVARQRHRAWVLSRGDEPMSFVVASSLGVRSALTPSTRTQLRRAGLGHLIAVSGLHVGLAAWSLLVLLGRAAARSGRFAAWGMGGSWVLLLMYVGLTGASASAVRAGLMAVGVGVGAWIGRPHHGPVLLAATCVAMLVVRPGWAFDPGFQLSAMAMAALVRAPAGEGIVRATWRVTWAVLPCSLWHFGQAGLWGIVSNLVAVPLFTLWVLPWSLAGWWLVPWLGPTALAPACWGARPLIEGAAWVAQWPSPSPSGLATVAAVMVGLAVVVGRRTPDGRLRPGWSVLPPLPVALAVWGAVAWSPKRPPIAARWWGIGYPTAPTIVTLAGTEAGAVACLHTTNLAASRWARLLDTMGIRAAGFAAGHERPVAPHAAAVRDELRARGQWYEAPPGCPPSPSAAWVRRYLASCRRRTGSPRTMVIVDENAAYCFLGTDSSEMWGRVDLIDSTAPEAP